MGTRRRTARQFQLEAMEPRWAPGGYGGIGGEFRQVQVAPLGGRVGGGGDLASGTNAPVPCGSKPGGAGNELCGSNSIRYGQEGNAVEA